MVMSESRIASELVALCVAPTALSEYPPEASGSCSKEQLWPSHGTALFSYPSALTATLFTAMQ